MKRLLALLTAAVVVGLGAASPALADSSTRDVTCTSTAYDGYKQVVCQDPDGVTVSDTTYYESGCVTTIDADGNETTTCPEVDPWIDPWTGMHPDDVSCDVEAVTDDSGATTKVVTCRNTDGDIVSQSSYSEDGCVTSTDADGNELTYCPSPTDCSVSVDADGNQKPDCGWGKPWLSLDIDNPVASVGDMVDGCRTLTLTDGTEMTACKDPDAPAQAEPLRLDDRGCVVNANADGTVWSVQCPGACTFSTYTSDDGAANESAYCESGSTPTEQNIVAGALCDYEQLLVDDQIVVLATCDDGCVELNGNPGKGCGLGMLFSNGIGPRTGMHIARAFSWDERTCWERDAASEWQGIECPKVLYENMLASVDGGVLQKSGRGGGSVESLASSVVGIDAAVADSGAVSGAQLAAAPAVITPAPVAPDKSRTIALASGNSPATAPMSPAVAALAVAAGLAGAASMGVRRVRVSVRRR
ncbi:MAG: hypothetical protein EB027_02650 [Actinobacteria bacterium]|nr:hypothetical protein [Actinomycetota bacterium]